MGDLALPWILSAVTEGALRAQARRLHDRLVAEPSPSDLDIGASLAATRGVLAHRAGVVAGDRDGYLAGLLAVADGREASGVDRGHVAVAGATAFLFTGQGSQRPGMGRALYAAFPAFAAALDAVRAELDPRLDRPLLEVMFTDDPPPRGGDTVLLNRTDHAQAAIFAFEVAVYRLLRSWDVRPDYLIGHSIGEVAAAHVAGILSLPDACALVAARGRLMQGLRGDGGMVALEASEEETVALLRDEGERVAVAAVNGPTSTVISGDLDAVERIAAGWRARGRRGKRLKVSHAFHSPHMDGMLADFAVALREVSFHPPQIPMISNVTGESASAGLMGTPQYWAEHVRRPVRFAAGLRALHAAGVTGYLEIGPDAALTGMVADGLAGIDPQVAVVATAVARAGSGEVPTLLAALTRLHVHGLGPDWRTVFAGRGRRVDLPTYAFEHRRYWIDEPSGPLDAGALGLLSTGHPIATTAVGLAEDDGVATVLTGRVSTSSHPWLADHTVAGTVVLPGTAFLDLAIGAGERVGAGGVEELVLAAPLALPARGIFDLQVTVGWPDDSGRRAVRIHSRPREGDSGAAEAAGIGESLPAPSAWTRHAEGTLAPGEGGPGPVAPARPDVTRPDVTRPPEEATALDAASLYERLAEAGYDYGPAFQAVRALWRHDGDLYATLRLPEGTDPAGFALHPALLDAALHPLAFEAVGQSPADAAVRIPFTWSGVRLHATGAAEVHVRLRVIDDGAVAIDVADPTGAPVATVERLVLRSVARGSLSAAAPARPTVLHEVTWVASPPAAPGSGGQLPPATGGWAVLGPDDPELRRGLDRAGVTAAVHADLPALRASLDGGPMPAVVVVAPSFPAGGPQDDPSAVRRLTGALLDLLRAWVADDATVASSLVVLTRGAVAARPGDRVDARAQAALWGLVRTAQAEFPDRIVLADLDSARESVPMLPAVVASGEPEVAVRAGDLWTPRLVRSEGEDRLRPPGPSSTWRLDVTEPGTLENLALVPAPDVDTPLAAGQVRVAVRAAGLNFRDVLLALGMYPGTAAFGSEGAGIVVEVAPDVTGLSPGDRVMGL
ncbi:acyltransferase domain-containing protein, partial [Frankia sp. CpI1-P]|uniref:acyltransferase domain-containing protein n=1 Tax=Frankia sp. CpI1-P TaxID=1502734 RepID=UPI001A7EEFDB